MRCSQTASKEFRIQISQLARQYCQKWMAPVTFEDAYVEALNLWLSNEDPTAAHHTIGSRQAEIGWPLFIRGFLSVAWRDLLEAEEWTNPTECSISLDEDSMHQSAEDDSTIGNALEAGWTFYLESESMSAHGHTKTQDLDLFLSGLIKLIWSQMSTLWEEHLDINHHNSNCRSSPARRAELCTKITILHEQRVHVLSEHKYSYFHKDLAQFLDTATHTQLANYGQHYTPVILASVRRARRRHDSTPSILSFPGFTSSRATPQIDSPAAAPSQRGRGATIHHKHSRWRTTTRVVQTIQKFFSSSIT